MKRAWKHDCNKCLFLGTIITKEGERDLYAHETENDKEKVYKVELLSRYGNRGIENKTDDIEHAHLRNDELLVAALLYRNLKI